MLERLVGHLCFISLCRRESLSILGYVFAFIQHNYSRQAKIWGNVRAELAMWDAMSPLFWQDLQQPWSSVIHSVDASFWGLGHCSAELPLTQVKRIGRCAEKWRYIDEHHVRAGESVFAMVVGPDGASCTAPLNEGGFPDKFPVSSNSRPQPDEFDSIIKQCDHSMRSQHDAKFFEPVTFDDVNRPWKVCGRFRWRRQQAMPILEHRAGLHAVKNILRSVSSHGCKHLLLGDSLTVALCQGKGR